MGSESLGIAACIGLGKSLQDAAEMVSMGVGKAIEESFLEGCRGCPEAPRP